VPLTLGIRIPGRCAIRLNERRGWPVHDGADTIAAAGTRKRPWEGGPAMRQLLLVVAGVAAALAGLVWTLQGLGYVGAAS
jgi:hypothetical protein